MAVESRESDVEEEYPVAEVSAYATSPEKTVFTEAGNNDGWIATDHTVELER